MRSPLYMRSISAVTVAIEDWMHAHPGADPQFKFPPREAVIIGELHFGLHWWEPNQHGRELIAYVIEHVVRVCGAEPSMLQFQACYAEWQADGKAKG